MHVAEDLLPALFSCFSRTHTGLLLLLSFCPLPASEQPVHRRQNCMRKEEQSFAAPTFVCPRRGCRTPLEAQLPHAVSPAVTASCLGGSEPGLLLLRIPRHLLLSLVWRKKGTVFSYCHYHVCSDLFRSFVMELKS